LIVGYYEGAKLRYASKVGTGFSNSLIRQFVDETKALRQPESPFHAIPENGRSRWDYGLTAVSFFARISLNFHGSSVNFVS
jgi:hypothetical protein